MAKRKAKSAAAKVGKTTSNSPAVLHISDSPIYVREVEIRGVTHRFPYYTPGQLARLVMRLEAEGDHEAAAAAQQIIDQYL